MAENRVMGWACAWTASISGVAEKPYAGGTVLRQAARVAIGGSAIRLRFTNMAPVPVTLSEVSTALREGASSGIKGDPVSVTQKGRRAIAIPPHCTVYTDPIPLSVSGGADLFVTVRSPEDCPASVHPCANTTQYQLCDREFRQSERRTLWLDAIDVWDSTGIGTVVVLGDSMSDRAGTSPDSYAGWTDVLGRRLISFAPGDPRRRAVVTAGIGGNTLGSHGDDLVGPPGLERLDRDVLSHSRLTEVLVFEGTNDLLVGETVSSVVRSLREVARRCKAMGARPMAATLLPRRGGVGWDDEKDSARQKVNDWLRERTEFEHVIDFDRLLDDGTGRMRREFDADGTHPNEAGHKLLGDSIDLALFTQEASKDLDAVAEWI